MSGRCLQFRCRRINASSGVSSGHHRVLRCDRLRNASEILPAARWVLADGALSSKSRITMTPRTCRGQTWQTPISALLRRSAQTATGGTLRATGASARPPRCITQSDRLKSRTDPSGRGMKIGGAGQWVLRDRSGWTAGLNQARAVPPTPRPGGNRCIKAPESSSASPSDIDVGAATTYCVLGQEAG